MVSRIVLALVAVTGAAAQPPVSTSAIASNPILGFETPSSWSVTSSSAATKVASTTTRTQGSFAFALINPPELTTMTSQPVASTASALAGLSTSGAVFELDVMPPPATSTGSLKLTVNSPSRGLKDVAVGEAQFQGLIPGIYNTMKFVIPDTVSDALSGASFTDLTFQLVLATPATSAARQFLFDNLRVYAVPLVTATTSTKPPAGFGGSVDLFAVGATPVTRSFPIGAVQVPDSFHLEEGTTGTTTVQLALGHDNAAAFTCTYEADSADATHESYILHSCTGGLEPGDIIGANFAQLTIVGGTDAMKLRPQLALNPVGDLVGRKIIPPMPTFWGSFENCTPTAPVAGKVQPRSATCAAQIAQASKIVTDYFNNVTASNAPHNWIVTPIGDFARRRGNGAPHIVHTTSPTTPSGTAPAGSGGAPTVTKTAPTTGACASLNLPPNAPFRDFPYDDGSHLNQGGNFDAFWALHTDMNFGNDPNTGNSCTHFEADFTADVVLFGQDVNVVSATANADTTSGTSPSATGSLHMFLFGIELPGGGSADASTGFNFNLSLSKEFDLPPIQIWIFSVTPGATAEVGVAANGTLAATGISLTVTPGAKMGVHVLGGVNIPGQVSGGIDAKIDLLDIDAPLSAQAGWAIDTLPTACAATINFEFSGSMNISAGGGEMDLVATIGPCPFCWSDSWQILNWAPLVSTNFTLFSFGPSPLAAIKLPISLCMQPLNVSILSPAGNVPASVQIPLNAFASNNLVGRDTNCPDFQWNVTDSSGNSTIASGQDSLHFSSGCADGVKFNGVGPRTVLLRVVDNFIDGFGRSIPQTGQAASSVNVVPLSAGAYIVATNPQNNDSVQPSPTFNGQTLNFTWLGPSTTVQFIGEVVGFSNPAIIWEAKDQLGKTTVLGLGATGTFTVSQPGLYTITMGASTPDFKPIGTATMFANIEPPIR